MKYSIGIIGKGFVGSAVSDGFSKIEQYVVDPKISEDNTIDKLVNNFCVFCKLCFGFKCFICFLPVFIPHRLTPFL